MRRIDTCFFFLVGEFENLDEYADSRVNMFQWFSISGNGISVVFT